MSPPVRVPVGLGARQYDIVIGPGIAARAGAEIAARLGTRRLVLVTDTTIAALHGETLVTALAATGHRVDIVTIAPGEASKSYAGFAELAERVLALGIDRKSLLVAFGGGVVGDLAGFAAATLLRGIDFVQVPTTLLAQVDSSVGGKTGIDSAHGKNLVGAFHQPRLVLADTALLGTLPARELRAGYAEIAKYGLLGDAGFFAWCEANGARLVAGDPAALVHAVAVSCRAKAAIVAADETEQGHRALLNLGHTFGHALEAAAGFGAGLLHGEAVAIGMVLAFRLSARLGLCPSAEAERVAAHLRSVGLPTSIDPAWGDPRRLRQLMATDKKAEAGRLAFVLVDGIGRARVVRDVPDAAVLEVLAAGRAA